MPVNTTHCKYDKMLPRWQLVRSIVDNCAREYIRTVDKDDPVRSKQYKDDAILTNFTRLTKTGLTGLVFRKPPTFQIPGDMSYILDNSTGFGYGLEQFCQQIVGEVLMSGRYGLLADMPPINSGDNRATIKPYTAESIINWQYTEYGSEYLPSLIVLKEYVYLYEDDEFAPKEVEQYRVLRLSYDRIYTQTVYNYKYEIVSSIVPVDYNGLPLDHIPFTFVGSENNDETMDTIPLYDMAIVNLGHYRNSADYEESVFVTGQPFLVVNIGETNEAEFRKANPGGIRFGSRRGMTVAAGGSAMILQANPNQLADTAMSRKEEQAVAIGARLIAPSGGRETAEAARIRYGSQNSALYTITKNIANALTLVLYDIALMMMEVPEYSYVFLNDQFYEDSADPNLIAQEMLMVQSGLMTVNEFRDGLKSVGVLPENAEEISPDDVINPLEDTSNDTTQ